MSVSVEMGHGADPIQLQLEQGFQLSAKASVADAEKNSVKSNTYN